MGLHMCMYTSSINDIMDIEPHLLPHVCFDTLRAAWSSELGVDGKKS